jgi:pimeloyl-ACP methyl ester carboxylesterase
MPTLVRDDAEIYYEEHGRADGYPLLLFAPGGMRSSIEFWQRAPWHPIRELGDRYRLIALDQRNAGRSRAKVREGDGWERYTEDHLGLLDHLRIERCHVLGGCIGGSFSLGLARAQPRRVSAAVLQQPIGLSPENRGVFYELFDGWVKEIERAQPDVAPKVFARFRERMYGGDFVFNVSREFVRTCATPLLVLMGNDIYHPSAISREIVALAPHAELVEHWKEPEAVPIAVARVRAFLEAHTPD